jgi:O-acetylhomoserine/O-acetylserine sulfhydrylase-like pyridoxal-dependent enzyme
MYDSVLMRVFQDRSAAALAFSSGLVAITAALLTIVHSGQDFISASKSPFGM